MQLLQVKLVDLVQLVLEHASTVGMVRQMTARNVIHLAKLAQVLRIRNDRHDSSTTRFQMVNVCQTVIQVARLA